MKKFLNEDGSIWIASVNVRPGEDYKGRFGLVMTPEEGGEGVELEDVRWNSKKTAGRTLETMSTVELRRRLRSALGRRNRSTVGA